MLRATRLASLRGCTCTCIPAPRSAHYSTTASPSSENSEDAPRSNPSSSSSSSPVYSRPLDAYDPLFADIPSRSAFPNLQPSNPSRPAPLQPFTHPTTSRAHARAPLQQARPWQKQTLSPTEAQTFANLLQQILPLTQAGEKEGGLFGGARAEGQAEVLAATEKVREALSRKMGKRVGMTGGRRVKAELGPREMAHLDHLREVMVRFESDLELLGWSMREVFGFSPAALGREGSLFLDMSLATNLSTPPPPADPTADPSTLPLPLGPASPIYPDLLLILFLLLRDTYNSPHTALHVFQLASSAPYSYVQGCHTALYNEVLRTRWMEGDVESVAQGVEEMRSAGVKMDDKTREIVDAIGRAIRVDEERAEARVTVARREAERAAAAREQGGEGDSERREGLTPKDEEVLFRRGRFFGAGQVKAWAKMERFVEENQEEVMAHQERIQDERWMDSEARRAREEEAARIEAERERPNVFFGAGQPRLLRYEEERERAKPVVRRRPAPLEYDHASPDAFSSFSRPTPSPRPTPTSRTPFSPDDLSHLDASSPLPRSFFGNSRRSTFNEDVPRRPPPTAANEDGILVLPKRPSFANPYKIRRQGLSREEKSKKDVPHPMMAWKYQK